MNAGFSNFDTLKKHLLGGSTAKSDKRFDAALLAIGLGMAAAVEKYCNRKFDRVVGDQFVCTADRDHAYVPRYPIETFTSIELKADINVGWEMQTGLVLNINEQSGLIYWGAGISFQWAQMRITYTGGFWWETAEPDDASYPSSPPAGSAALPDDVKLAWLLQCESVWAARDKLGAGLSDKPDAQSQVNTIDLSPIVKQMLSKHIRYVML
jgi:hypothetical protein